MLKIVLFTEGGTLPNPNQNAATVDGTAALRGSMHKLLAKDLETDAFRIEIDLRGGNNSAIKEFKAHAEHPEPHYLLVDLDAPPSDRAQKLKEWGLEALENRVFCMVQEMEAWILSQPAQIEANYRQLRCKKDQLPLNQCPEFKDLDPESVKKPCDLLNTVLQRYYQEEKRGKIIKKKYASKMRDGAELLGFLDINQLEQSFSDVKRLRDVLRSYLTKTV